MDIHQKSIDNIRALSAQIVSNARVILGAVVFGGRVNPSCEYAVSFYFS